MIVDRYRYGIFPLYVIAPINTVKCAVYEKPSIPRRYSIKVVKTPDNTT